MDELQQYMHRISIRKIGKYPCLISNLSAVASLSGRGAGCIRPGEISHNAAVFPLCVGQSSYEPPPLLLSLYGGVCVNEIKAQHTANLIHVCLTFYIMHYIEKNIETPPFQ
ncbi:hypothetical protein QQF64_026387 [Cirrhinus molitorella]|uniref:Uncharacterized protein n=1 Tax=Cirrhinus molitorella TaxID=172907 RepID=A0ABR3N9E8_9TELE